MLNKNLEVMENIYPDIFNRLTNYKEDKNITYFKYIEENATIKYPGGSRTLYDYEDPMKNIEELSKKEIYVKENVTIIIGMGLGHLVNKILEVKEKDHRVVIIEPILDLVTKSFTLYDFTKYITDRTLLILTTLDEVQEMFGVFETLFVIENWITLIEQYTIVKEIYHPFMSFVTQTVNQLMCNIGTIMGAGATIAENDISNLPYVLRYPGVVTLKDKFKETPAVIVSTGPSLEKNIHILKENQDRVIIIAVAQALRILLAYEVKPDFICTVDYGKTNYTHFEGLMDSDVPLVALNRTYKGIIKEYQGPKIICASPANNFVENVCSLLEDKGFLPSGGSVAHMCLQLAFHIGCNKIMLIGQDLSTPLDSHSKQADSRGTVRIENGELKWKVDDPKSNLYKEEEYSMGMAQYVEGYLGDMVLTNIGLASFIHTFEQMYKNRPEGVDVINCTEGGAKIKGIRQQSLRKVIRRLPILHISNKKYLIGDFPPCENEFELYDKALTIINKDIENLIDLMENCDNALKWNKEIIKNKSNNKRLKKALSKNETYSNKSSECAKKNPLVNMAIYRESRRIQSRALNVKGKVEHLLKNKEDLEIRVERNKLILEAAKKSAKDLLSKYHESKVIIETYLETKDLNLVVEKVEYVPDLSTVEEHLDRGNFARPLLDINKFINSQYYYFISEESKNILMENLTKSIALQKKTLMEAKETYDEREKEITYLNLIEEAQIEGRENQNYKQALKCLEKAYSLFPNKEKALWGLATVNHFLRDTEKSLEYYEQLIKTHPEVIRYKFEYAQVLLHLDVLRGLSIMEEVFQETEEYDYFLKYIGDLYKVQGKINHAKKYYKKYLEKYPEDEKVKEIQ